MDKREELITLLKIENQEWEISILEKWIARDGIDYVFEECTQILEEVKKMK